MTMDSELRDAELLAEALEQREPGRDLAPVDDALGAAMLVRASRGEGLSALRARAVLERVWPKRTWVRPLVAALAAIAAASAWFFLQPVRPAKLPAPGVELLRAQLSAARPGASTARLDAEMAGYRRQVYSSLERAYGGAR